MGGKLTSVRGTRGGPQTSCVKKQLRRKCAGTRIEKGLAAGKNFIIDARGGKGRKKYVYRGNDHSRLSGELETGAQQTGAGL